MAKLYSETPRMGHAEKQGPKNETLQFILAYSKALSIINYNNMKFETFLN